MSLQTVAIWTKCCRQLGRKCCLSIRVSINVINRHFQLTRRERERENLFFIFFVNIYVHLEKRTFFNFGHSGERNVPHFLYKVLSHSGQRNVPHFLYKDFSHSGERNVPHFLTKISVILERGTFLIFFRNISAILKRGTFLKMCLEM